MQPAEKLRGGPLDARAVNFTNAPQNDSSRPHAVGRPATAAPPPTMH